MDSLSRWHTFMKWASGKGYKVHLERPTKKGQMYNEYHVRLFVGKNKCEACDRDLDKVLDNIKNQLLA